MRAHRRCKMQESDPASGKASEASIRQLVRWTATRTVLDPMPLDEVFRPHVRVTRIPSKCPEVVRKPPSRKLHAAVLSASASRQVFKYWNSSSPSSPNKDRHRLAGSTPCYLRSGSSCSPIPHTESFSEFRQTTTSRPKTLPFTSLTFVSWLLGSGFVSHSFAAYGSSHPASTPEAAV
jgi:hypothetical protein